MNLSRPFVTRPVATMLLSCAVAMLGAIAWRLLPVADMPQVDLPAIVVLAQLPGASPQTVASAVATPLERRLSAIAGVEEMTSESSAGACRIVLLFDLSRDIHGAESDVQAAIQAARQDLPASLRASPTYRAFNPADSPVLILALTSGTLATGALYDTASTLIQQRLLRIAGVGDVALGGGSLPAVRVDLDPQALFEYGIGLEDVRAAIAAANAHAPVGAIDAGARHYQIRVNDTATAPARYRSLIVAFRNGAAVRLGDIARVSAGVENVRTLGLADGRRAVLLIIRKQPGANVIDTVRRVKAALPGIRASIPRGINLFVASDRTPAIRDSLRDVEVTLLVALLLVVTVVVVMLRNPRAALAPAVAVPLSLLGTLGVIYLLGFTLNNLSLMALTVSTGFVVDDAIVVIENISRHVEAGMPRMQAALQGAREVGFTVLAMSSALVAVFIPLLLMGGMVGRILREFALTLAVTVALSLLISLTSTPMLCGRILRRPAHLGRFGTIERGFNGLREAYGRTLTQALRHPGALMLGLAAVMGLNLYLFAIMPKGFFPRGDSGVLVGFVRADESISFEAMQAKLRTIVAVVRRDPAVAHVVAFTGGGDPMSQAINTGMLVGELEPRGRRKASDAVVIARLRRALAGVTGAQLYLQTAGGFHFGAREGYGQYQYTLLADSLGSLDAWVPRITAALQRNPALRDVAADRQPGGLEVKLHVERAVAARLGVDMSEIDNTLYDAFGQRLVSTLYEGMNQYHVVMEVAPRFWRSPGMLRDLYVSTSGGALSGTQSSAAGASAFPGADPGGAAALAAAAAAAGGTAAQNFQLNQLTTPLGGASTGAALSTRRETMVPLAAFSHYGPGLTPLAIAHQGPFVATTISFNLPRGEALGTAVAAIGRTLRDLHVPIAIHGEFAGNARVFQRTLFEEPLLILGSLLAVYVVLGVLYESLTQPITILSTLPASGIGAVLALLLCGEPFTLIALIGVILLIGIVLKNAIMMVDVALQTQRAGHSDAVQAIRDACLLRFRPIVMTSVAALLGALPLVLIGGQGAQLRRPLGIAIVGGLLVSQFLTLYTTPVVYISLDRFRAWCARTRGRGSPQGAASARGKVSSPSC